MVVVVSRSNISITLSVARFLMKTARSGPDGGKPKAELDECSDCSYGTVNECSVCSSGSSNQESLPEDSTTPYGSPLPYMTLDKQMLAARKAANASNNKVKLSLF